MTVIAPSVCQGSICARAVRQSSAGHFCPWHSHLTESLKQWPWLQPGWAVPYHTCARREYSSLRVHVPFLLIAITTRQSIHRTLVSLLEVPLPLIIAQFQMKLRVLCPSRTMKNFLHSDNPSLNDTNHIVAHCVFGALFAPWNDPPKETKTTTPCFDHDESHAWYTRVRAKE